MLYLSFIALLAWIYLAVFRGRFWEADVLPKAKTPQTWPGVTAIVPARDESRTIADTVRGILQQDYPGALNLVIIDDQSGDETAARALEAATAMDANKRIRVIQGNNLPAGWKGKVWAMQQGWEAAKEDHSKYIWFTDADIAHEPQALRNLIAVAEAEQRGMVSTMVRLRCHTFWEHFWVPAFIYFFKLLYPFSWITHPKKKTAGAAGGCMLARKDLLKKIHGLEAISDALIDDCSLAKAIQEAGGTLRLNLTTDSHSLRGYPKLRDAWNTVARSAYTQLAYSPLALAVSVIALAWLFFVPVAAFFLGGFWTATCGALAWLIMMLTFLPSVQFYRVGPWWLFALPVITILYLGATIDSALRYHRGQGGQWKGRAQA